MKKIYLLTFLLIFLDILVSSEIVDNYGTKYDGVDLIPIIELYDNDTHRIIYIDYFTIFPKYNRAIRDNYIGYQNNCIESRIYFENNSDQVYEVYFDRKECDGKIKMIVDKTGEKQIILKNKR